MSFLAIFNTFDVGSFPLSHVPNEVSYSVDLVSSYLSITMEVGTLTVVVHGIRIAGFVGRLDCVLIPNKRPLALLPAIEHEADQGERVILHSVIFARWFGSGNP
jgi:hypothetical protein